MVKLDEGRSGVNMLAGQVLDTWWDPAMLGMLGVRLLRPATSCPGRTLPQPRSLPAPRSKSRRNRTSPPRVVALTNMVGPPLHLLSQTDVSRRRPVQKTPVNSTPPSPLALAGLMASTVQWGPTVRQLSSNLLPSSQHLWGLAPHDNNEPYWKKVGAH